MSWETCRAVHSMIDSRSVQRYKVVAGIQASEQGTPIVLANVADRPVRDGRFCCSLYVLADFASGAFMCYLMLPALSCAS